MKRLLAALAALCIAGSAVARTAIVDNRGSAAQTSNAANNQVAEMATVGNNLKSMVLNFINAYNPGSVDYYTGDQVTTASARTGSIKGTTYTSIIWVGPTSMGGSTQAHQSNCIPCSYTTLAGYAKVPMLFFSGGLETEGGPGTAASCSTSAVSNGFDPGTQGPDYFDWRAHIVGSKKAWPLQPGTSPAIYGSDNGTPITMPSGTTRVILGADASNMNALAGASLVRQPKPAWRDSVHTWNTSDPWFTVGYLTAANGPTQGMLVWTRYLDYPGVTDSKPVVFAAPSAHHTPVIGGGTNNIVDNRAQPDPIVIYTALAFLDSLTSRDLLGTNIEPKRLAVQISGGFRRGAANGARGFAPFDTNTVKASCDSIAALGIGNIAVGVNPNLDSLSTYASDLYIWKRLPGVRFAVEAWNGISDSTKVGNGSGAASAGLYAPRIVDPFGRFRSRVFVGAVSDTSDTSAAGLLKRGKQVVGSLGVPVDGIAIAASDDISPRNWNSGGEDSLALALDAAGLSGVAMNADDSVATSAAVGPTTGNRWAWNSTQRFVRDKAFLAFPGFNPRGSTYGNGVGLSGTGETSDSSWCIAYAQRSVRGLFNQFWVPPQKYPWLKNSDPAAMGANGNWWTEPGMMAEISPKSNIRTGTNIVRISASSLGSGESTSSPNMPGFYTLKYLKYQIDALNSFGRTLVVFTSPDGISPTDILR